MIDVAALAAIETGLDRLLRLDGTFLPRLRGLSGKVIAIHCRQPDFTLFILPHADGLQLASRWLGEADCTLRAPLQRLLELVVSAQKTNVLHQADVELEGDSATLLALAEILQNLELDWEYELSRWLGPLAASLIGAHLRSRLHWLRDSAGSLRQILSDCLSEESRQLLKQREAQSCFAEIDTLKLTLDRLQARIERLEPLPEAAS